MSTLPNVKGHPDRMIAANSLGWIPTRDFWADGGVNSILTVVPSPPRAGSKLPSKAVAYFMVFQGDPEVWRLGPIYNSPSFSANIDWRERLWRTYLGSRGYAPFICSSSRFLLDSRVKWILPPANKWSNIYWNDYPPSTSSYANLKNKRSLPPRPEAD